MGTSFSARSLMAADDAAWRIDLDKNLDKKQIGNLACWAIVIVVLLLLQNLWQTASQACRTASSRKPSMTDVSPTSR